MTEECRLATSRPSVGFSETAFECWGQGRVIPPFHELRGAAPTKSLRSPGVHGLGAHMQRPAGHLTNRQAAPRQRPRGGPPGAAKSVPGQPHTTSIAAATESKRSRASPLHGPKLIPSLAVSRSAAEGEQEQDPSHTYTVTASRSA